MGYILAHMNNVIGIIGVALVLWTYLFVQLGKMAPNKMNYSFWNLIGSLLILISLMYHFNLSSFVIEIAWTLISVYGIIKCLIVKKRGETHV